MIEQAGHQLAAKAIVLDDEKEIRKQVKKWIKDPEIDAVITTGGTGFAKRDVTPEAVKPLFEKDIDGFATVFHMVSFATSALRRCSRGPAAAWRTAPSSSACLDRLAPARTAGNGILKLQLDNRHRPCSFIEVMPRLKGMPGTKSKP